MTQPGDGTDVRSADDAPAERAVLQRDLSQLLTTLSIALHRHAMYPPGHPSLVPVLEGLARRLHGLLGDRPRVAVGVARDQLVIEGIATDPRHPLLRGLAERLHRHHLAVIEFEQGLTTDELLSVVEALASDPERGEGPLGARARGRHDAWPHVGMHPLTVEGLAILEGEAGEPTGGGRDVAARCSQLWIGLANAALERARGDTGSEGLLGEPAVVARAIDEHARAEAYDQVVVGYLLQIAEELRTAGGADAGELRRRTAQLVGALHPETLRRLLDMGGDALQRQRFVSDVTSGMAASAVVDVVEAAAAAAHETLSTGLLRLLSKLAAHAELGAERVRPLADAELRAQVQSLIGGWELADPHPDDYRAALEHLAHSVPVDLETVPDDDESGLAMRLVQMSLELDEDSPALGRAVEALVDAGRLSPLLDLLRGAEAGPLASRLVVRLSSPRTLRALLGRAKPDFAGVSILLPILGDQAIDPLLDTLAESDDRQHRRAAFDLLRRAGSAVLPIVRTRLSDTRWYVIRNLLSLLAHIDPPPDDVDPSPWLAHADGRVRREALRIALRLPHWRDTALEAALSDEDPSVLGIALASAHDGCPPSAVPAVMTLATSEYLDDDLRASAMRALGSVRGDERVLHLLLKESARDSRRLPWQSAPPQTAASLAALAALTTAWGDDRRAARLVRRARRSSDPDIRRAAGGAA